MMLVKILTFKFKMLTVVLVFARQVITEYVYKLLEEEVKLKKHIVPVSELDSDNSNVKVKIIWLLLNM